MNVMQPDKNGIVAPTHTLGSTIYQGRNVTRPPQFNGSQPSIGPAPQSTLDPVASTVGRQLVTSIPAVVDEVAEVPMLGVYTLKGVISGNWTDAKYQAMGVFLPGISKTTIKTLVGETKLVARMSNNYTSVIREFSNGSAEKISLQLPDGFKQVSNEFSWSKNIYKWKNIHFT
ncbi:MAG: hypothetical protein LC101_03920 [Flavobacteriales bacterium]|nr:hypothetical protein [Flavobacteriales bacterium]